MPAARGLAPESGLCGGHQCPRPHRARHGDDEVAMADRGKMIDRERLILEVKRASGPAAAFLILIIGAVVCVAVIFKNIGITMPWTNTYQREVMLDNAKGVVPNADTVRL